MPTAKLSSFVNHLGRVHEMLESAADGELLARFIASRDEPAFAELVRRHGRLVFGVCRRVTGHHHLAEDAFQAVFVVLATKAAAIRPPSAVAAWLHGVAFRTALRARTMADRRRRREAAVGILPGASSAVRREAPDAVGFLDEEIARLPDHYRLAVVLCELEGVSRKDAARRLGINEGTLSSRLAAARKALADRLRQRGVALSTASLSAMLAQAADASPSLPLSVKAASALSPELIPAPVAALSHGVLRIMFLDKLKIVALLAAVALGVAACVAMAMPPEAKPSDPPKPAPKLVIANVTDQAPAKAEAKPSPQGPNKILFYRSGFLTLIDPDGKNEKKVSQDAGKFHPGNAQLSPDGKSIAVLHRVENPNDPATGEPARRLLHIRGLEEKEPGTNLGIECQMFFWSPDGNEIVYSDFLDGSGKLESTHGIINVKTQEKTALPLPKGQMITDWSRDGKYFLTTSVDGPVTQDRFPIMKLHLMNRDGTEFKKLTDGKRPALFGRLSPDGKQVLFSFLDVEKAQKRTSQSHQLHVLDIATGKIAKVEDVPLNAEVTGYCWSPDTKRIAYSWREIHEGKREEVQEKETETFLIVCDPDGKNQKTVASEKGQGQWVMTIAHVDWR